MFAGIARTYPKSLKMANPTQPGTYPEIIWALRFLLAEWQNVRWKA